MYHSRVGTNDYQQPPPGLQYAQHMTFSNNPAAFAGPHRPMYPPIDPSQQQSLAQLMTNVANLQKQLENRQIYFNPRTQTYTHEIDHNPMSDRIDDNGHPNNHTSNQNT